MLTMSFISMAFIIIQVLFLDCWVYGLSHEKGLNFVK